MAEKEVQELQRLLLDSEALRETATRAVEQNTLEETEMLQRLNELSGRLLTRNQARTAFARCGAQLLGKQAGDAKGGGPVAALEAATATIWPAYFRYTPYTEEEGQALWTSKLFLNALPCADGTTLCIRFSFTEQRVEVAASRARAARPRRRRPTYISPPHPRPGRGECPLRPRAQGDPGPTLRRAAPLHALVRLPGHARVSVGRVGPR